MSKQKETNKKYITQILIAIFAILIIFIAVYAILNYMKIPKDGDTVLVDYILYVGGDVFDTSIKEDAVEAGIFNEAREYKPLEFVVGEGQVIKEFEDAVKHMRKGQTKDIEIKPEDGYGDRDESKIFKGLSIVLILNKTNEINMSEFLSIFQEDPAVGKILENTGVPWGIKVLSVNDDIISVENLLNEGQRLNIPGTSWESVVENIDGNKISIRQYPEDGDSILIPTPIGSVPGVVINVGDETYDIDLNSLLAGKVLKFKIILREIEKKR